MRPSCASTRASLPRRCRCALIRAPLVFTPRNSDSRLAPARLQIRLADGSRKVVKANKSHTVLQLRAHVATLTPGVAFTLKAGFPPKELTEMEKSLEDAGLLGEAIVQSKAN